MKVYVCLSLSLPLSLSLSHYLCLYNRAAINCVLFFWGLDRTWGVCSATSITIHTSTRYVCVCVCVTSVPLATAFASVDQTGWPPARLTSADLYFSHMIKNILAWADILSFF